MMSEVSSECLKSVLLTRAKNIIRVLYVRTHSFRLPIASAIFRYYCIVLSQLIFSYGIRYLS